MMTPNDDTSYEQILGETGSCPPEPTRADFINDEEWECYLETRQHRTILEALEYVRVSFQSR